MHKAELLIFDKIYPILDFELTLEKEADTTGLPVSNPFGGKMIITFASGKNDTDLIEAAMGSRMMVRGIVRMYRRDGIQKLFDYEFANAYLLLRKETFDATSKNPLTTKIIIAPGILKKEDWIFENYWNPSNPFLTAATPISSSDDEELQIVDCYYTDLEGNEVAEPAVGEEVYLVVHSENGIGETTDIDLSNQTKDFMYNGEVLENDILKDYLINSDEDKIKLRVVAQQEGEKETLQS